MLNQNFSVEEQASLVWKLLCSIPTSVVAKFLPWLSSSISPDKYQDLHKCLSKIVPEEKFLQQVIDFSTANLKLALNSFRFFLTKYIQLITSFVY